MKISIFIVDDAESDRDAITYALNDEFDVTGFFDPVSFLNSLSSEVSIVITDVRIPGYDVFETIQYIHDNFPGIYIIVISGYFDDDIYERLFELGVDRVVKKNSSLSWARKVAQYVNDLIPKIQLKLDLLK